MRRDVAAADRAAAVRQAARGWQGAGLLDAAAVAAVEARFPDDRNRLGPVFRVLVFGFSILAISGGVGFVALAAEKVPDSAYPILALLAGLMLTGLTELFIGRLRLRQSGIEAATSLMALCFLFGAAAWHSLGGTTPDDRARIAALGLLAVLLCAAAAWRWGYPFYAAAAAAAALVVVATLPAGRLGWIVLPLVAAPVLLRLTVAARLAPAHRDSAHAMLLVALVGLAVAIHPLSCSHRLVETIGGRGADGPAPGAALLWTAMGATGLLPLVLFVAGVRRRSLSLLLAALLAAVSALVTIGDYLHFQPAWLALILGGALALGAALAARRYLESGEGGERGGLTTAPLLVDPERQGLIEIGATVLTLPAPAHHPPPGGDTGFVGGGGSSGGGGASAEF